MARPQALLFDLDGTLIDSLDDIRASANAVREAFGLPALDRETTRGFIGDGVRRLLERSLPEDPVAAPGRGREAMLAEALALWDAHHDEQCTRLVRCYDGVSDTLVRWRADGHALAVVTNKPHRFAVRILQHLGIADLFGAVVGGDSTPERKPSPRPLLAALEALGATWPDAGGEAVMVGDGLQDLEAGRTAGCGVVAVHYGFGAADVLAAAAPDTVWSAFGVPAEGHTLWPARRGAGPVDRGGRPR